ncbi:hypothetical protein L218DRAFT_1056686 [Marasmius fiardii PR-910]|nr:hypothetical protein L218DRAFT_1056686 [Marasmius fiardii PR-910]
MYNPSHVRINHGEFAIVNRDQYNINHHYSEPKPGPQFAPEDEWKTELSQEGTATFCHLFVRASRIILTGRMVEMQREFLALLVGPDATKFHWSLVIHLHPSFRDPNVMQLHAFNDSQNNPLLFFHDSDCQIPLLQFISLQEALIPHLPFYKDWAQLWTRPQDGAIVYGPEGPSLLGYRAFPRLFLLDYRILLPNIGMALELTHQVPVPALPLNLCNHQTLVKHLATWLSGGFLPPPAHWSVLCSEALPSDPHLAVCSLSSASPHAIAQFPDMEGNAPWKLYLFPNMNAVFMDDRTIRPLDWDDLYLFLYLDDPLSMGLSSSWLAQALHIFQRLNIPQDDWVEYGCIKSGYFCLIRDFTHSTGKSHNKLDSSYYLFVYPIKQCPNGFPDTSYWMSGKDLYYWSHDPDGHLQLTEEESVALDLPCFHPKVQFFMRTWSLKDYDFVQDFQKARGFDPTTTDFAHSLGCSIAMIVYPGDTRFEIISDVADSNCSASDIEGEKDLMEVDCLPLACNCESSSLAGGVIGDIDVDVDDYCSQEDLESGWKEELKVGTNSVQQFVSLRSLLNIPARNIKYYYHNSAGNLT